MSKLISFEFRKILRQKSLYICLIIVLGLIGLSAAVNASLEKNPEFEFLFTVSSFTKQALSSASFFMILGIFVALYCCDDVANNTLKNLYSRGFSRGQVYFSKYIVSLIVSEALAVICFLFAFLTSKAAASEGENAKLLGSIFSQLILVVAYHAVYFSVATIIGKVGGSVVVNIAGPMLVLTVLTLITSLLKLKSVNLGDYWLESAMQGLTVTTIETKAFIKAIVMGIIYTVAFVPVGYVMNKKKEL
ncbi:MAG: ABC transporter permease [Roseburia sp.]|nr:ABC transporter permease [Anaeroplasma bactoclasticum]MCM1196156.1 ABC transporter permease [Roseburia sp.]